MIYSIKKLGEIFLQIIKFLSNLLVKNKQVLPEKTLQIKVEMSPLTENIPVLEEKISVKIIEESDQLQEIDLLPQFVHGGSNLADGENTKKVRKYINYEFGLNFNEDCLQCVEYAQYRVKEKLGIWIEWPVKSGRDAKYWPKILNSRYIVSEIPVVDSVASFDAPSLGIHGHVVFVENIFSNGEIEISEVNLPHGGIYNFKRMAPAIWRDRYNGKFIIFS